MDRFEVIISEVEKRSVVWDPRDISSERENAKKTAFTQAKACTQKEAFDVNTAQECIILFTFTLLFLQHQENEIEELFKTNDELQNRYDKECKDKMVWKYNYVCFILCGLFHLFVASVFLDMEKSIYRHGFKFFGKVFNLVPV